MKSHVNLEINNQCQLDSVCGADCILNWYDELSGKRELMSREEILGVSREFSENGRYVSDFAIAGKEPFMTPDLVRDVLSVYYGSSQNDRPNSIGCVTNGLMIKSRMFDWLERYPFDWMAFSTDFMHGIDISSKVLDIADEVFKMGGAKTAHVNTIIYPFELNRDSEKILDMGRKVSNMDSLSMWTIAPFLRRTVNGLVCSFSYEDHRIALDFLIDNFGKDMRVLYDVPFNDFQKIVDEDQVKVDNWRLEYDVPDSSITVISANLSKGKFIRVRYDGSLIFGNVDFNDVERYKSNDRVRYRSGILRNVLRDYVVSGEVLTV